MDFKLPKGLDFVPNSVQRDEVRLSRSSHSIYMNEVQSSADELAEGIKTVRLLIQPNGVYNIAGDRGAVKSCWITLWAAVRSLKRAVTSRGITLIPIPHM